MSRKREAPRRMSEQGEVILALMGLPDLRNLHGPLDQKHIERLRALLDDVTPTTWDDANGIILSDGGAGTTLWQWCALVDREQTRAIEYRVTDVKGKVLEDWSNLPSRTLIAKAMRAAARHNRGFRR